MDHWRILMLFLLVLLVSSGCSETPIQTERPPNVILIMTDDQGIGDVGYMGNPIVSTPTLDSLAARSLNLLNFYVSPVCAPTRASLMTGRYSERTGVYDTYNGGAVMRTGEITMAEVFREHGYRTGIFGKWHLGDNYPFRPIDQGFDVSLTHKSGGLGQPGDPVNYFAKDSAYFNPVLYRNGQPVKTVGYCSDVYTDGAIEFINLHGDRVGDSPYFLYLSFNAPHTPLQLPQEYYEIYGSADLAGATYHVKDEVVPSLTERELDAARKVYGMVTNIDDNIARLMQALEQGGESENTIVVFLTDNGPQQNRYRCGLRGKKSSVYEGGIKVPCFVYYPERFPQREELSMRLAHVDLLPTLMDLCGLPEPDHSIDGLSFYPMDAANRAKIEGRTLFFEWGRGFLQQYRNIAVIEGDNKLVGNAPKDAGVEEFELFDLGADPFETVNLVAERAEVAGSLKQAFDTWYEEVIEDELSMEPPRAIAGTVHENPILLNRNDAKGNPPSWTQEEVLGHWDIALATTSMYDLESHFIQPVEEPGRLVVRLYPYHFSGNPETPGDKAGLKNLSLKAGEYQLEVYFQTRSGRRIFPLHVTLECQEPVDLKTNQK